MFAIAEKGVLALLTPLHVIFQVSHAVPVFIVHMGGYGPYRGRKPANKCQLKDKAGKAEHNVSPQEEGQPGK